MKTEVFILAAIPINVVRLRSFLKTKKSVVVSGHTSNFETALQYLGDKNSGVLLIDDAFFDKYAFRNFINSISATAEKNKIVVYTGSNDAAYFKWFADKGIRGIVHKESPREEIVDMLKSVNYYHLYLDKPEHYKNQDIKIV